MLIHYMRGVAVVLLGSFVALVSTASSQAGGAGKSRYEHVMYGGELQCARRSNFLDGFHANDYRLQFSFKYNFAAQIGGVK